jgi:hypothetical protein
LLVAAQYNQKSPENNALLSRFRRNGERFIWQDSSLPAALPRNFVHSAIVAAAASHAQPKTGEA